MSFGAEINFDELFDGLDLNNDGVVDYDEFIITAYNRVELLNSENLKLAFNLLDKNNDGTITSDEL